MTFDPTRPPSKFEVDVWPGNLFEQLALEMAFQYSVMVANQNVFNAIWPTDIAHEHVLAYMGRLVKEYDLQWPQEVRELVEIRLSKQFTPGGV